MKTILSLRGIIVIAMAAFVLAPFSARAAETIRIGVCLSLSEENSETGRRSLAGIKMRQEEWNRSGGQPLIELVIRDDQGNPKMVEGIVAELVETEKVPAIIGPGSTQLMFTVRNYLAQHRVVAISPSVTHPDVSRNDDWTFRLLFDDDFQSRALARFVFGHLNMRRAAAVLNTHYPYSESAFKPFAEQFERLGGKVVHVGRYSWRDNANDPYDFTNILSGLEAQNPEVVFLPLYAPEVAELVRESLHTKINAVFCGADTWESEALLMSAGNNLNQAHYVSGVNMASGTPEMEHFLSVYDVSNEPYAEQSSVFGYDAMSLLLAAMKNGHDAESIRDTLYTMKEHPLATGPITIDRRLGTLRPAYIHRIVKRGNEFRTIFVDAIQPEETSPTTSH